MTSLCSNLELQNWRPSGESTTKLDLGNSNRLVEPAAPIDPPSLIKRLEHKIKKKKKYMHIHGPIRMHYGNRVLFGREELEWDELISLAGNKKDASAS